MQSRKSKTKWKQSRRRSFAHRETLNTFEGITIEKEKHHQRQPNGLLGGQMRHSNLKKQTKLSERFTKKRKAVKKIELGPATQVWQMSEENFTIKSTKNS